MRIFTLGFVLLLPLAIVMKGQINRQEAQKAYDACHAEQGRPSVAECLKMAGRFYTQRLGIPERDWSQCRYPELLTDLLWGMIADETTNLRYRLVLNELCGQEHKSTGPEEVGPDGRIRPVTSQPEAVAPFRCRDLTGRLQQLRAVYGGLLRDGGGTVADQSPNREAYLKSLERTEVGWPANPIRPLKGRLVADYGGEMPGGSQCGGQLYELQPGATVASPADGYFRSAGGGKDSLIAIETDAPFAVRLRADWDNTVPAGRYLLTGEPLGTLSSASRVICFEVVTCSGELIDPRPWMLRQPAP